MSLPPLDFDGACAKCGQWSGDAPMNYGFDGMMTYADGKLTVHDEYLERTCLRCGYRWKEACDDAS